MASNDPTSHLSRMDVEGYIYKLIDSLVNIKDESGEFLLKLEDGRIVDPKGWNDWEVRTPNEGVSTSLTIFRSGLMA